MLSLSNLNNRWGGSRILARLSGRKRRRAPDNGVITYYGGIEGVDFE